jgi:hypothetical protein
MIDDEYDEGIEWMQNMPLGFGHNNYVLWAFVHFSILIRSFSVRFLLADSLWSA